MITRYQVVAGQFAGDFKEFADAERWAKVASEQEGTGYSIWAVEYSESGRVVNSICMAME